MSSPAFSDDFQDLILGCAVEHPEDFVIFGPIINSKHYAGVQATIAAKVISDYYTANSTFPPWVIFEQAVIKRAGKTGLGDGAEEKAKEYVQKLRTLVKSDIRCPADVKHVAGQVVEFCRYQAMLAAIKKNIELLKEGKPLDVGVCEQALQVGQNMQDMGVLLSSEAVEIAMGVIDKVTQRSYGVRTGYSFLDRIWKNGWAPGWLIVPLAPPKRWKSTFAINLALNMASPAIGSDILYFTCEISDDLAAIRAMCNIGKTSLDTLYDTTDTFKAQVAEGMRSSLKGEILVKGYPARTATIADLKAFAKRAIQQGLRPKAIIIDYADTVKVSGSHKEKKDHLLQADVYTEARAMGAELGVCIIMPDRATRETVGLAVPNMQSFQGAFEKGGIVDIAIGICADDSEIKNNIFRLFVFLNRHGPALQHFQGVIDPGSYRMEVLKEIPYEPDSDAPSEPRKRGKVHKNAPLPPEIEE